MKLSKKQRKLIEKAAEEALGRCTVEKVLSSKECIVRPANAEDTAMLVIYMNLIR